MSHDRGCPCGRESYEYADCVDTQCFKTNKNKNITRDALVFIGRFQPFHKGHKAVIDAALDQAKEVVIVVGSSFTARNIRNPFTFFERKAMIEACFTDVKYFNYEGAQGRIKTPRVHVVPVSDYPLDDSKWVAAIQKIVDETVPNAKDVGLIGHSKDSTSYYLNIFPRWKNHVEVANIDGINATDIRKVILTPMDYTDFEELDYVMPKAALALMSGLLNKPEFKVIRAEYEMVKKYKEAWKAAPYAPTFVTTDAVVEQSGHVLLIERGHAPGKGLWALPGGFLNQNEAIEDGMIRELREETRIKLQPQVLRGSIVSHKVVDNPERDPRGRTITHAFHIKLKDQQDLPHVRGSDDAAKARWFTLSEILKMRDCFFNDHFHILAHFLKIG